MEQSVLDFFVFCSRVRPYFTKIVIDESKKFILTNYQQVRNGGKANDSDHNTQYLDLDIEVENDKPERIEILNYKEKLGQSRFKEITSNTDIFSNCFLNNRPLSSQIEKWESSLKNLVIKHLKR